MLHLAPLFFLLSAEAIPSTAFKGVLNDKIIWMDLELPKGDGKVKGSYVYTKYGKPIRIEGERTGRKLHLQESLKGKLNGIFNLTLAEMEKQFAAWNFSAFDRLELRGTWSKPGRRDTLDVYGFQVDPAFRSCALIPADSLQLASGRTFGAEMDEHTDGEFANPEREGPRIDRYYEITSCGKGLFSASISWTYTSAAHPAEFESGSARFLFDLARKREIVLDEEIEPGMRKAFAAWLAKESGGDLADNGDAAIYLDHDTIMIGRTVAISDDPEEAGKVSTMEEHYVPVPIREFVKYLKKDSALRSLDKPN